MGLPCPDALDEGVAAHFGAAYAFFFELPFNKRLGGDTGMVGARLPQNVFSAHPLITDQDILKRVVERVPHMERTGDIGGRDNDAVGVIAGVPRPHGLKGPLLFPKGVNPAFRLGGVVSLVNHGIGLSNRGQDRFKQSVQPLSIEGM